MVTLDRIRLTGLLPKSPATAGLFQFVRCADACSVRAAGDGLREREARDDEDHREHDDDADRDREGAPRVLVEIDVGMRHLRMRQMMGRHATPPPSPEG